MSSGGVVGLSNNTRGKLIGGWIGIGGNKVKLLNGWVGDENNRPQKIYTTAPAHGQVVYDKNMNPQKDYFDVPAGVTKIDIFCVGGAGGSCTAYGEYEWESGSSWYLNQTGMDYYVYDGETVLATGGSGKTDIALQVPVTEGERLKVHWGAKGINGGWDNHNQTSVTPSDGSDSYVYKVSDPNNFLCHGVGGGAAALAPQATSSTPSQYTKGGDGGSGGRCAGYTHYVGDSGTHEPKSNAWAQCAQSKNGSDGSDATASGKYYNLYSGSSTSTTVSASYLGKGQHSTTKAFTGTQYDNFNDSGTVIIRW